MAAGRAGRCHAVFVPAKRGPYKNREMTLNCWPGAPVLDYARTMPPTLICPVCDQRLRSASDAMRRHSSVMARAIALSQAEHTEEQRREFTANLVGTFNDAQVAWDVYRQHLVEHGIVPN
jgi:hypothetical protein